MVNITEILLANLVGIALMGMLFYSNRWRLREYSTENGIVIFMIITTIVSCLVDILEFWSDGKPGFAYWCATYWGNGFLYLTELLLNAAWLSFVIYRLRVENTNFHVYLVMVTGGIGVMLLLVNFYTPIVFTVDEANQYQRGPLFLYYLVMEALYLLDSIILYIRARLRGGMLKFFPIWLFVLPTVIGVGIQAILYGVSTIWVFVAISISGIMASLQNEVIFRDGMTGLYNRYYLDNLKDEVEKKGDKKSCFTAMMMDLNGFKLINDKYGHSVGDRALIETATSIANAVGVDGSVIRYAGDEFVVILNTQIDSEIESCIARIHGNLNQRNARNDKYHLELSLGWCKFDMQQYTVDELINEVDQRMYEEKEKYYALHPEHARK